MPHTILPAVRSVAERNRLVEANQALVWWTWHKNRRRPAFRKLGEEDAVAAGQLGLIRAADLWDPDVSEFTTYAPWWIFQAMQRAAAEAYLIRVPAHHNENARAESRPAVAQARRVVTIGVVEGADGEAGTWQPFLSHDPTPAWLLDGWEELQDALRFVPAQEREPFLWYYRDGLHFNEIAVLLGGVTKERVRQLINGAARRVCKHLGLSRMPTAQRTRGKCQPRD